MNRDAGDPRAGIAGRASVVAAGGLEHRQRGFPPLAVVDDRLRLVGVDQRLLDPREFVPAADGVRVDPPEFRDVL